jgi:hypothetical protein
MNNGDWAVRLFASIAVDLELHGLRRWWETSVSLEDRDAQLQRFPSILPKWWLLLQSIRCAIV